MSKEDTMTTLAMAARLTAAFLRGNAIAAGEIPSLVNGIHAALQAAGAPQEQSAAAAPAVPIKRSITPAALICLECGSSHQMLKRHLMTSHGLSVDEYRAKWALPTNYPMTAPDYAARRSALAVKGGLGRKKVEVAAVEPAPSDKKSPGHRYPQSRWTKPR